MATGCLHDHGDNRPVRINQGLQQAAPGQPLLHGLRRITRRHTTRRLPRNPLAREQVPAAARRAMLGQTQLQG
ncbi:hypothetical protein G6F24_018953 [Rhizopus arrhizus]|nr:hypothetical protein G6F24_018953 [Rhizopus arrhizus]